MKIGLDFDGVIADTGELKSRFAKKLYNLDIEPSVFGTPYVVEQGLISAKDYADLQQYIYNTEEVYLSLKPVYGAVQMIRDMQNEGHDLLVITAKSASSDDIKRKWLEDHDITIGLKGVGINESKAKAAEGLEVYIDDYLLKLYQLKDTVPHRYLFSWRYNQAYKENNIATRVYSWEEFYNRIKELSKDLT